MTQEKLHSEKLKEIEERWKAFKHWMEIQMQRDQNPDAYSETAGPDMEWCIARIKELETQLEKAFDEIREHDLYIDGLL